MAPGKCRRGGVLTTKSIYRVTPIGFEPDYIVVEDGTSLGDTTRKVTAWVSEHLKQGSGYRVERLGSVDVELA